MHDFSQSKEQAIILNYFGFREPATIKAGTALSLGENDGETFSNVRALALLGWFITAVEPADIAFGKLANLYAQNSRVRCVQAAIAEQDGPIDFYDSGTHLKKGDTSLLSTTRPEEMARWAKSGETFTKTTVRGITVETLLKEAGLAHADFISIDCEGVDLQVLRQLDLTALGCRLLCVEVNRADQRPFDEYCAKHGLKLLHRNWENAIYGIK